jgi:hypothetical protein
MSIWISRFPCRGVVPATAEVACQQQQNAGERC